MQRKSLSAAGLFLAGLLAPLAGPGCRRVTEEQPPPPHRGATVRVACPADVPAGAVRAHAPAWAARQQAHVEVVRYDPRAGEGPPPDADVWALPPAELARWAAAGKLLSVPRQIKDDPSYEWRGLLPLYRELLIGWDGVDYALPLLGEAPVCVYRSDWLADPARQKAYAEFSGGRGLHPPATWEEFALLAEFFRRHHPSGKPGPSLPPLPANEENLDRLFYTVAAPHARRAVREEEASDPAQADEVFPFHYDTRTGRPRAGSPGMVDALRLLRRLQACRPEKGSADPEAAFREGRAVLCLTDASRLVSFQKVPALRDRFGICAVPGSGHYFTFAGQRRVARGGANRVPYLGGGGWLAVVPRGARRPEAAWDLLASLTGPAVSGQVALEPRWGGGPTRQEHLSRDRWDAFDLDAAQTQALKDVLGRTLLHHGLKNPAVCLRTPDQAAHRAALAGAVRAALAGEVEPDKALAGAAKRWEEMDARRPAHLAEYRLSLGLLAR